MIGIDEQQKADIDLVIEAETEQNQPVILALSNHISDAWQRNYDAKREVEQKMIDALRTLKGEYDPAVLANIKKFGGSDQFMRITDIKCKAMIGWLKDILLSPGEKPFGIDPTPISDIKPEDEAKIIKKMTAKYNQLMYAASGIKSEEMDEELEEFAEMMRKERINEIQEEAMEDAKETTVYIDDILVEAKFYVELSKFINDVVHYPAGIMEGPIVEIEPKLEWQEQGNGTSLAVSVDKAVRKYYRVSPFDAYPAPGALTPDEGDFILKRRFTRSQLLKFKGVTGFNSAAIDLVLNRFGDTGFMDWLSSDSEIANIEEDSHRTYNNSGTIDCLKYFGSVQGTKLLEWGMDAQQVSDPYAEYEIIAYKIENIVISAKINPHPLKKRGIFKACFSSDNESFWGDGLPDVLKDLQKMCNACVRAWVRNMGIASGPQVWVNTDAMPNSEDASDMYPLKVWPFSTEELKNGLPMGFFQPQSNATELMNSYKFFFDQASEISGIPQYMSGSPNVGGAGDTARGLSMLMEAASKTMKDVIGSIDMNVIVPIVEETWLSVMLYEPEKAKGDINIVARASDYLVQKETMNQRRQNYLTSTNNPTDMEIIGLNGRAEVLRSVTADLKLPVNKIIPQTKDLEARMEEKKLMQTAQTIADTLNVPVEVIIQAAQGQAPQMQQ